LYDLAEEKAEIQYNNEILAMLSPEGEKVSLGKGLKARGNVEDWLGKVEEGMFSNLRKLVKTAMTDFQRKEREEWVLCHASQVCSLPFVRKIMTCFYDVVFMSI